MTNPVSVFNDWLAEAREAGVAVPEGMTVATADAAGRPSARMLLLKSADESGFTFFSGYESRKGLELVANPRAALLFYWRPLGRQVRVEGQVERVLAIESDAYFATRPRGAQLAAVVSRQGRVLRGREELDAGVAELEREHEGGDVARPEHWGGYRLTPESYEFWQHREDRLHDRLRYRRAGDAWLVERLSP